MKRFLLTIGCWTGAIIIVCIALNPIIDSGLRKMTAYNKTQTTIDELLSDTIHADILIMGNSRALCSYEPVIISESLHKKTYNIGVSGQPMGISYLRYRLYREHNKAPQILIINMDDNELALYSSDFGKEQYYPYFRHPVICNYLRSFGFTWRDLYVPLYKYQGDYKLVGYSLMSLAGLYPLPYAQHTCGYYNADSDFDISELRAELQSNDSIPAVTEQEAVGLLSQLLQEVTREGVQPVFVYAPQYELLRTHLQMTQCIHVYDSLAAEYHIPILDYSAIEWSNDSAYFYNANHVNRQGAALFTVRLAHDIDSITDTN